MPPVPTRRLRDLPRLALTAGEPAGIGPELIARLAATDLPADLVAIADPGLLTAAAANAGIALDIAAYDPDVVPATRSPGSLRVIATPLAARVQPGRLDARNARHVLDMLARAADGAAGGEFDAIVTAPVHKAVINDAGVPFTGHTEFLAARAGCAVVMMLAAGSLRVALATTHLPLAAVSGAITQESLVQTLGILDHDLRTRFGIARPRIAVLGLNPHAGEGGHLGREEIDTIAPAIAQARAGGLRLSDPLPADTAFLPERLADWDAVLAMYHDQGLPVLKHAGFGHAVNVTLGLPYIRTSVDHGTALDLAGSGRADAGSLIAAARMALELLRHGTAATPASSAAHAPTISG
ncbi:MAG TPA: 4-hydroxythreonine-4-phosphate dehydrogenase PdxA [Rhodanobacteraceae bacterium]|nr:4-hydroxythreonine-4-phosphate dehydrogenase PdxA [Rhodanobacteraceae bacterium]